MNYNYFQEFAENPMFEDVAVYNRTVMTAESLPYVVDKAVREAYKHKGVAVVAIPNNFGYVQIPDEPYSSSSPTDRKPAPLPLPTDEEVKNVLDLIKAADEAFAAADLVIALGSNFPFANIVYRTHKFKFVQIDADSGQFGSHRFLDYGVLSDAAAFVEKALELSEPAESSPFFRAVVAANKNWQEYMTKMTNRPSDPLEFEAVYKEINRIAEEDALFSIDVGDNIITSNVSLNFIKSEQDDLPIPEHSGIFIEDQDFAMIARGMGVEAVTATKSDDLPAAFDKAVEVTKAGRPFLIDAKITDKRGMPVEELELHVENGKFVETINPGYNANGKLTHPESVEEFFALYDGEELKPITYYFDKEGVVAD